MFPARGALIAAALAVACGVEPPSSVRGAAAPDAGARALGKPDAPFTPSRPDAGVTVPADLAPAPPGQVRVVQCNPYYAGRLAPVHLSEGACTAPKDCASGGRATCDGPGSPDGCWECIDHRCRQRSWETAKDLARRIGDIDAEVIGMQELPPAHAPRLRDLLGAATGDPWESFVVDQGIGGSGSGVGVLWNSARVALESELGHVDVDTLPSGYVLRFAGVLLRHLGSRKRFAVVAGKLWWEAGQGGRRGEQAARLRDWIERTLSAEPAIARIVAIDLNDVPGSPAHQVFGGFDDGGAVKNTCPGQYPDTSDGRRIDFLFWGTGGGAGTTQGFVTARSDGRLGRSGYFGSDHRFVYGDGLLP